MAWFVFPLATAVISGAFAAAVARRWLANRRRNNLLWALGLFAIMGAAACQLTAELSQGWPEAVYRLYYFLAGTSAAALGAGTMYLLKSQRAADYFLYAFAALAATQALVCAISPMDTSYLSAPEIESGVKAASPAMRYLTVTLNIMGTAALLAGALLSFGATRHAHNLLIAAGTVVFASGGSIAGLYPEEGGMSTAALYIGNLIGITLLFFGFWLARAARPEAPATVTAAAPVAPPPV
jgi:hypothetical protein